MAGRNRAGFAKTWLSLDSDLGKLNLDPFNKGMSSKTRTMYTLGVIAFAALFLVFLDPWGAILVVCTGLYVIWNPGNQVTKKERKIFITAATVALFLGVVEKFSVFLQAAGLLTIAMLVFLFILWRR